MCYDGVWGSVCNEQWTVTDARVACNQLELPVEGNNNTDSCFYMLSLQDNCDHESGATNVTDISTTGALIALSGLNYTGDEEKLLTLDLGTMTVHRSKLLACTAEVIA